MIPSASRNEPGEPWINSKGMASFSRRPVVDEMEFDVTCGVDLAFGRG